MSVPKKNKEGGVFHILYHSIKARLATMGGGIPDDILRVLEEANLDHRHITVVFKDRFCSATISYDVDEPEIFAILPDENAYLSKGDQITVNIPINDQEVMVGEVNLIKVMSGGLYQPLQYVAETPHFLDLRGSDQVRMSARYHVTRSMDMAVYTLGLHRQEIEKCVLTDVGYYGCSFSSLSDFKRGDQLDIEIRFGENLLHVQGEVRSARQSAGRKNLVGVKYHTHVHLNATIRACCDYVQRIGH